MAGGGIDLDTGSKKNVTITDVHIHRLLNP